MSAIPNVVRRGGRFHFRRVVPAALRQRLGRRELVRSLQTSDARAARLRGSQLYVTSEHLFAAAHPSAMLSDYQLTRLVQDFYETILKGENDLRLRFGFIGEEVRAQRQAYYSDVATRTRDALACNRLDEAEWLTRAMLNKQGVSRETLDLRDLAKAKQAVLRAGIDVAEALQSRYAGDFNHEPKDKLLRARVEEVVPAITERGSSGSASAEPAVHEQEPTGPLLSDAGPKFKDRQLKTKAWDAQTAAQAGATYRLMIDVCGNRPLGAYTRKDVARFRELVEQLPGDYSKAPRYRGLSVEQIVSARDAEPATTRSKVIAQTTVKRHFSVLSKLWANAQPRGDVAENIFSGFQFAGAKKASEQRDMWQRHELAKFFNTPIWIGSKSAVRRSTLGKQIIRDEKFWLPLIAVFSGLRQEEICQLRIEDVRQEDGIWFFDINERAPRKLKNSNAVRKVPLHQELIRLGLLDRVAQIKSAGHDRLFPDLEPGGADGRLGHAFTKWFTRYRRDVGLYRPGLDFHSFRHSATTFMHQAGVQDSVIDRVTGHATPGETARYTKDTKIEQLNEAINAIDIDVDLSRLREISVSTTSKA